MQRLVADASAAAAAGAGILQTRRRTAPLTRASASATSAPSTSGRTWNGEPCIYKAVLAYDGTAYCGFQKQPNGDTVQERVERALERIFEVDRQKLYLFPAGRTDTGVHATGQVVSFHAPAPYSRGLDALTLSINSLIPDDIRVTKVSIAPPGFSARFSCVAKEYHYCVMNGDVSNPFRRMFAHYTHLPLNWDAMQEAAISFEGVHNYSAFANITGSVTVERDPVRLIRKCRLVQMDGGFRIEVEGSGFLYKQVRNMVGAILRIGQGRDSPAAIAASLRTGQRPFALKAAPALGLHLHRVFYPEDEDLPEVYRQYADKVLGHQVLRATTAPEEFLPWDWKWSDYGPADLRLGSGAASGGEGAVAADTRGAGQSGADSRSGDSGSRGDLVAASRSTRTTAAASTGSSAAATQERRD